MSLHSRLRQIGVNYVMKEIEKVKIPEFQESVPCRIRVTFGGRVQKICFRLEMREIAMKINVTGFCKNLENGDVVAEVQGERDRVEFLVSHMSNIKRAKIKKQIVESLQLIDEENDFLRL